MTRPSQFGSILVALARSREIRTLRNLSCELSLWPLTFLNYTKMTKYEALEKNAVSEPEMPQPGDLHYSRNSRKPHFIGRFSAYSLMEKLGGRNEWRSERNSNCRYVLLPSVFTSVDGSAKTPRGFTCERRGRTPGPRSRSSTLISATSAPCNAAEKTFANQLRIRARDRVAARKYPLGVSNETPTGHCQSAIR